MAPALLFLPLSMFLRAALADEPVLVMPEPQPCIEGLFADDPEFAVYEGLPVEQIRDRLAAFQPTLLRCASPQRGLRGTLELQVTVGCDGRVQALDVLGTAGLREADVTCLLETFRHAAFPAHDTPSGVEFLYPMTVDVPAGATQLAGS